MKLFSLILSVITFTVTAFFLISEFPDLTTFNGFIYATLMFVLLLICITGIIFNVPAVHKVSHRHRISYK